MKVSICCITYNHEKFVRKAIEGFLSQRDVDYEIIISDDCSTDRTRDVLREYLNMYPDKIKLALNEKNLGMMNNFIQAINLCKGEYIALCEGDDYWTDSYKLQKQVKFLDENEDYVMCCHRSYLINGKKRKESKHVKEGTVLNLEKLAERNCIYTASVVFRNVFFTGLPEWIKESPAGDYIIWMLLAEHGDIFFMNDIMSAYRINSGVWTSQNTENAYGKWVKVLKLLESYFNKNEKVLLVLYNQHIDTRLLLHNYFTKHNLLEKADNEITLLKEEIPLDFHYLLINNLAKRYQDLLNSKRYRLGTYLSKFNLIRG